MTTHRKPVTIHMHVSRATYDLILGDWWHWWGPFKGVPCPQPSTPSSTVKPSP